MSTNMIVCEHIGVSGTTPCHVREVHGKSMNVYEARMGFALMGATNMTEQEFKACGRNPFHEEFHDNYVHGFGATKEEAIENMKKDLSNMQKLLFI